MYNELSTNLRKSLKHMFWVATTESVKEIMREKQKVQSHIFMAANVKALPKDVQDDFKSSKIDLQKTDGMPRSYKDFLKNSWQEVPVPIACPLPQDKEDAEALMKHALNDTQAMMYIHVTEAIGVKESVLNQNESLFEAKPSDAHPDCILRYVVVSVMANKLRPETYAAEVTQSIIDRDGNVGRKLKEFKPYTNILSLPQTKHCQIKTK